MHLLILLVLTRRRDLKLVVTSATMNAEKVTRIIFFPSIEFLIPT